MKLSILHEYFAISKLNTNEMIPNWATQGTFFSITRTQDELSIVCEEKWIPQGVQVSLAWRAIQVIGPLDFSLTGILNALTTPLAEQKISIFAISTFDTDYLLVKASDLERAVQVLMDNDHLFI